MARRSSPSAPRKASPWARPRRSIPSASNTRMTPGKLRHGGRGQLRRTRSRASKSTRRSTSAARRPATPTAYMGEGLDAFKSGQVAMMMNWFAFMPGMSKDEKVGGDKIGFFVNPGREGRGLDARRAGHLGRRQYRQHGRRARLHQMVRPAGRAEEVVGARRLCLPQRRAERSGLQGLRSPSPPTSSKPWAASRTSGRSRPMPRSCRPCRSACTTMSSPTRAPPRRRSTG